jgi:hypothetical protein
MSDSFNYEIFIFFTPLFGFLSEVFYQNNEIHACTVIRRRLTRYYRVRPHENNMWG